MLRLALGCFLFAVISIATADNHDDNDGIAHMLGDNVQFRPDTCLEGDKHLTEPKPEPETESHVACHQWRDSACCTPEFTQQLAEANITNIDGFHWNRCGELSSRCQQFFIDIECFYRCSPNIAHFSISYPSAFGNLPLCSDYCDDWYDACKDEMTCAVNWISDWEYLNGINHCKNSTCLSYRSAYGSGRGICETLWGDSFIYANQTSSTPDSERYCLVPSFPVGEDNPNIPALRNIFPNEITIADTLGDNVQFRPDTCLEGDKHLTEPKPEPETESHVACHQWRDSACCTPEFTQQLAEANITNIDGFHWNRCGELSSRCQQFFIDIECFYRCSPNIAHFSVSYPSAFSNLPLCSDYCDDWYDACKDEMTCAVNWIFDWVYVDGINHCKNNTCLSYRSAYGSGRGICETLWGDSFIYADQTSSTPDSERYCLVPSFPVGEDNPNIPALRNIFPDEVIDDGNGAGHQIVSVTFLIAAVLFAVIVEF